MRAEKLAEVIEGCADVIERHQARRDENVSRERDAEVEKLAAQYTRTTGTQLSAAQRAALHRGDSAVLQIVKQATEAREIPALGGPPAASTASVVPGTTEASRSGKEARRQAAWDAFEKQNS